MSYYLGMDIGGTKCALTLGLAEEDHPLRIVSKVKFPTVGTPDDILDRFFAEMDGMLAENGISFQNVTSVGISCGGPLDAEKGIILSPPNLPGWDEIHAAEIVSAHTGVPTFLENDANACAVAEWMFGAGRGKKNVVFLTFGTGLGAGLILDGRLYRGTNGNAGEIGHVRLREDGPRGYGKYGSAEGFCSGAGIAKQGKFAAINNPDAAAPLVESAQGLDSITAKHIGDLAESGDVFCQDIYSSCGKKLGEAISILIDLFNPECVILGGIYLRSANLLKRDIDETIQREALPFSSEVCEILPAGLGEKIGDYAALAIAKYGVE